MKNQKIGQFFREDGTLINIPVKTSKKIAVLKLIAKDLAPELKYSEKDLNQIISKYHGDTAAIRRHMIEYQILNRDQNSIYWLNKDFTTQN